jgi:hypothetical protein
MARYSLAMPYDPDKQTRSHFLRKLSYYACGLAIGFMMLGVWNNARKQRMLSQKQDETARQLAPVVPSKEFPPPPAKVEAVPQSDASLNATTPK